MKLPWSTDPPLLCHVVVSIPLLIAVGLLWVISANKIESPHPQMTLGLMANGG